MIDKPRISFAQMLREIDDAGLDVYEFRLWCHIWRVGVSWESVRTMAKKCGMSVGKAAQAKRSLMERNYLAYEERNGRLGLAVIVCSPHEQVQQLSDQEMNDYNSDPVVDVHHMNTSVHHVNAILSMPIEDSLIKGEGDRANGNGRTVSPPPIVIHGSSNRTPGGNGFTPPMEPEPEIRPPSPETAAVGEMANAITDVTGVSARLNWSDPKGNGVGDLAAALVAAGYTADQVRRHYSKQPVPGWNWYEQDWRGKKGESPTVRGIRETISGATQVAAAPKKLSQIERALALFGNSPNPAAQGG